MDKKEQIEELSKEICNGCRTRHDCENKDGFCIMSDVVAEWLIEKGYRKIIPNVDFVVRASDLVKVREKAIKDVLRDVVNERVGGQWLVELFKKYGVEIEE